MSDPQPQESSRDEERAAQVLTTDEEAPAGVEKTAADPAVTPGATTSTDTTAAEAGPATEVTTEAGATGVTGSTGTTEASDAAESTGAAEASDAAEPTAAAGTSETTEAPEAPEAPETAEAAATGPKPGRTALLTGIAVGVLGIVVAVLAVTAYAWPGFLAGPGSPNDVASRSVQALAGEDASVVGDLTCKGPDGAAVSEVPPQLLTAIQTVQQTGDPTLLMDTQAQVPVTVTLSAQGQTQDVQAGVLLGVTGGKWCLMGLTQQQ